MKNSVLLPVLLLLSLSFNIKSQVSQQWISSYNGLGNFEDNAFAIAVDPSGNVYVTGYSYGSGTDEDCVTIKYSNTGAQLWAMRYNGPGNSVDVGSAIAFDASGNVFIAGYSKGSGTDYDCLLIKYSPEGVMEWVQRYDAGNKSDRAFAVLTDALGNVYITGESISAVNNQDYITIKYNASGVQQWAKRYNGTGNSFDNARRIAIDPSGNICVTGYSMGIEANDDYVTLKYTASGDTLWVKRYNGSGNGSDRASSIATDNSGNIYVSGTSFGNGTRLDGVTIKYSPSGTQVWVQSFNGTENLDDYSNEIGLDGFGNIYVTGSSYSNTSRYNYITAKYNPSGVIQWLQLYNGPSNSDDTSYDIAVDNSGNTYVSGWSMDTIGSWAGIRYATVKYNSSGVREWVQRFKPQQGTAGANDIALDGSGNVFVTGLSTGIGTSDDYTTIKYSQSLTVIQPVSNEIPNQYSLSQNYPNPFNPSTKIKFSIPQASLVAQTFLSVYDMLGREVTMLVNEELNPGTYEVEWNASNYPSGVYFYTLSSGEFRETKKMLMIK